MSAGVLTRLASMDAAELRFRVVTGSRNRLERARAVLLPRRWRREDLRLNAAMPGLADARRALAARRWQEAHRTLARHFASRRVLPANGATIAALAAEIRQRYPGAAPDAAARARRIRAGRYDLLGYEHVDAGSPPAWHHDPIHRRSAPQLFWSSIPYLDPAYGDHKIIWELNRHQHWLALMRSRALNGDRESYAEFVDQLRSWMAENPPLAGINWASMLEIAFRSLSWIVALHAFAADAEGDDPSGAPWTVDLLLGLERQLGHAARNVSRYFSPNTHLSGEALALYVAGQTVPELASSAQFSRTGRTILLDEIGRQIGGDGLHAELSAHYHRYSTDFYLLALLVARATGDAAAVRFEEAARRQARALRALADDRGRLPLVGDDDGGQLFPVCGPRPADAAATLHNAAVLLDDPALAAGDRPEECWWFVGLAAAAPAAPACDWPSTALDAAGYYVARDNFGNHAIVDAGPHGFLNGGHAHADALSIVASVRGVPLLVDPGTATYTMSPELRDRFRSTAMHNTVTLNGRSQSEPRGPFHWRSRANARARTWRTGDGFTYLEAAHDGYAPARHARIVAALHGLGWIVIDRLDGGGEAQVEAFWHLHPDWAASRVERTVRLRHANGLESAIVTTASGIRLLDPGDPSGLAAFAPVYGQIVPAPTVVAEERSPLPCTIATFVAADPAMAAGLAIRQLDVETPAGSAWSPVAVEIDSSGGRITALAAFAEGGSARAGGPGAEWGSGRLKADGRAAFLIERDGGSRVLLVDGSRAVVAGRPVVDVRAGRSSGAAASLPSDCAPDRSFAPVRAGVSQSCVE